MAKGKYGKIVWYTDLCVMESPRSSYLKRLAEKYNKINGTKSKFSGPFTDEELERFNSIHSTGKW